MAENVRISKGWGNLEPRSRPSISIVNKPTRPLAPTGGEMASKGGRIMSGTRPPDAGWPMLALNAGSSSLKFALYAVAPGSEQRLARGAVERIGVPGGRWWLETPGQPQHEAPVDVADATAAVRLALHVLDRFRHPQPVAVGHRFVTGGPALRGPLLVTPTVRQQLADAIPYAPLHVPLALTALDAAMQHFPHLPQIVSLDTTFHARMPLVAQRLPLPRALFDQGVRRYGFHGLSVESIVDQLAPHVPPRLIVAHLGSGASVTALQDGVSVDTTMSFTPTGGIVMATRPGDLDPGILTYLLTHGDYDVQQLAQMLNEGAGLRGISAQTGDMLQLLANPNDGPAQEAVAAFVYAAHKAIGALATVLAGLDALVFTGGIGEHAAAVRAAICAPLRSLGVSLDAAANQAHRPVISTSDSRVVVQVLPAEEERMLVRHAGALYRAPRSSPASTSREAPTTSSR